MTDIRVIAGDCLAALRPLPDASVDAVVTDPPYGLAEHRVRDIAAAMGAWLAGDREHVPDGRGFMGRDWDAFVPPPAVWDECLRVLRPGGHMLVFAGSRTVDLMGLSIRLAGFELRDGLQWLYGSGFPKGIDVARALDRIRKDEQGDIVAVTRFLRDARKAAGFTNAQVDTAMGTTAMSDRWTRTSAAKAAMPTWEQWCRLRDLLNLADRTGFVEVEAEVQRLNERKGQPGEAWARREVVGEGYRIRRPSDVQVAALSGGAYDVTAPATDAARQWTGWNTSLKPGHEPIVLARKPLAGTVARNVLEHGTGALNIDATRVAHASPGDPAVSLAKNPGRSDLVTSGVYGAGRSQQSVNTAGRWPANVLLSHLPECGPVEAPQPCPPGCAVAELDAQSGTLTSGNVAGSKRSTAGGNGVTHGRMDGAVGQSYADTGGASRFFPSFRYQAKAPTSERPKVDGVAHPTIKPLALMAWLVRLVTPPGGVVLDPFAGSGSTGQAARDEGMAAVLIEREPSYLPLIAARLDVDASTFERAETSTEQDDDMTETTTPTTTPKRRRKPAVTDPIEQPADESAGNVASVHQAQRVDRDHAVDALAALGKVPGWVEVLRATLDDQWAQLTAFEQLAGDRTTYRHDDDDAVARANDERDSARAEVERLRDQLAETHGPVDLVGFVASCSDCKVSNQAPGTDDRTGHHCTACREVGGEWTPTPHGYDLCPLHVAPVPDADPNGERGELSAQQVEALADKLVEMLGEAGGWVGVPRRWADIELGAVFVGRKGDLWLVTKAGGTPSEFDKGKITVKVYGISPSRNPAEYARSFDADELATVLVPAVERDAIGVLRDQLGHVKQLGPTVPTGGV